uniref:Uncharacterized protein n=1 Tax=Arundo donax TaxID=35708 RepID=A0A0A9FCP5_ARUDO
MITEVGGEGVPHVSLSENGFSYHVQQYKVGINVYYMQPYPETSSTVVHEGIGHWVYENSLEMTMNCMQGRYLYQKKRLKASRKLEMAVKKLEILT